MAKWLAIIVGVLTIVTFALDLPEKLSKLTPKGDRGTPLSQPLAGSVRDDDNRPLRGVTVSLPELKLKTTTDEAGRFELEVKAIKQAEVSLMAQKEGYEIYDSFATLGNTSLEFTMFKEK